MLSDEKRARYHALTMEILDSSLKPDAATTNRKSIVEVEAVDLIELLDMMDMMDMMRRAKRL